MSEVSKGSCMCGTVKYEYTGLPFSFSLCHCRMCRKFSGSPFGAFVGVEKKNFRYVSGENEEKIVDSSDWAKRSFCQNCGSSLQYILLPEPDKVFISAGTHDTEPTISPKRHIFVKDKCAWFDITDKIPQIERF